MTAAAKYCAASLALLVLAVDHWYGQWFWSATVKTIRLLTSIDYHCWLWIVDWYSTDYYYHQLISMVDYHHLQTWGENAPRHQVSTTIQGFEVTRDQGPENTVIITSFHRKDVNVSSRKPSGHHVLSSIHRILWERKKEMQTCPHTVHTLYLQPYILTHPHAYMPTCLQSYIPRLPCQSTFAYRRAWRFLWFFQNHLKICRN